MMMFKRHYGRLQGDAVTIKNCTLTFNGGHFNYGYTILINGVVTYYAAYPSFESNDGEYSQFLCRYDPTTFRDKNFDLVIENYLLDLQENKMISIVVNDFDGPKSPEMEKLSMSFLIIAMTEYLASSFIPTNVNRYFKQFMEIVTPDIVPDGREVLSFNLSYSEISTTDDMHEDIFGIKLIPLYTIEALYISFLLRIWQEKLCLLIMSDSLLSMHCRGLPAYLGDTYLYNTNGHLFQNKSMILKYSRGEQIEQLREKFDETAGVDIDDDSKISGIRNQLNFASISSSVSPVSLLLLQEHLGNTWDSSTYMMMDGRVICEEMQQFLFDVTYDVYIMSLQSILHFDLALNNVVITYGGRKRVKPDIFGAYTLHVIGANYYLLPDFGPFGGIIDFSRSFVFKTPESPYNFFPFRQNFVDYQHEYLITNLRKNVEVVAGASPEQIETLIEVMRDNINLIHIAAITYDLITLTDSYINWSIWSSDEGYTNAKIKRPDGKLIITNKRWINPLSDFNNTGLTLREHFAPSVVTARSIHRQAVSIIEQRFSLLLDRKFTELANLPNPIPGILDSVFTPIFGYAPESTNSTARWSSERLPTITKHPRYNPQHHRTEFWINSVYSPDNPSYLMLDTLTFDHDRANLGNPHTAGKPAPRPYMTTEDQVNELIKHPIRTHALKASSVQVTQPAALVLNKSRKNTHNKHKLPSRVNDDSLVD
jgi:hypothetical protein